MRTLKLKALDLGVKELLNREQLKKILGGTSGPKRGRCCATAGGDGYGQNAPACSDCVDDPAYCTVGVLVACS